MEFQKITMYTKVIMLFLKKYINDDPIYQEKYLGSFLKKMSLKIKNEIVEEKETVNLQDFMEGPWNLQKNRDFRRRQNLVLKMAP